MTVIDCDAICLSCP